MKIEGFVLVNAEKVERALHGVQTQGGEVKGGVVKADGSYDEGELMAEYDKLGGLITRDNDKVETGSFYDFKAKAPRKEPKVVFLYRVNGKEVKVADGKELPGIVKAKKALDEQEEAEAPKKGKKVVKKGKKADAEDDE